MDNLPAIKKKVFDFLSNEDGRISKQSAVKLSIFGAGAVLSFAVSAISAKADFYACRQNAGDTPAQNYCIDHPNSVIHSSHSSY
jgi:hypothetical protein